VTLPPARSSCSPIVTWFFWFIRRAPSAIWIGRTFLLDAVAFEVAVETGGPLTQLRNETSLPEFPQEICYR
jgi:hypothetical protein